MKVLFRWLGVCTVMTGLLKSVQFHKSCIKKLTELNNNNNYNCYYYYLLVPTGKRRNITSK
jgi:hypothetical protein